MVEVNLWSGLRAFTGGKTVVEVEGDTMREVLDNLAAVHPGLASAIEAGVSVAIDGRVIASSLTEPVPPDAEVFLMQRLKGG